jgi:hypothetical protein
VTRFGPFSVRAEPDADGPALDAALAGALVVRAAARGDRLAGHGDSVARMLLEARVPRPLRAAYPVLEAAGELVCVPGIAIAPAHARSRGVRVSVQEAAE